MHPSHKPTLPARFFGPDQKHD